MSTMEKTMILHTLEDFNDIPALERFFREKHCPEVLAQAPWTARYCMFRCLPPPPGAEDLTWCNYRLHENWNFSHEERRGVKGLMSFTANPPGTKMYVTVASVPAEPTDDFLGAYMRHGEKTILRWVQFIKYPEGVPLEEGEEWFLHVHVPEVKKQPGLLRFFSHKATPDDGRPPLPESPDQAPIQETPLPNPLWNVHWDRVNELWYENNNGWVDSNLTNPPAYTAPKWATCDRYPFLKPGQDFVSAFVLEYPDQDMLRTFPYTYF